MNEWQIRNIVICSPHSVLGLLYLMDEFGYDLTWQLLQAVAIRRGYNLTWSELCGE